MSEEHIRHWRIGDVEVARIVEVNAYEDDISMLLKDETAEFVKQYAWLRPHFATAAGQMMISFQAFVLRSRGKNVMIDTCIGADRNANTRYSATSRRASWRISRWRASPPTASTPYCARICISIMSAGIRIW